MSKTKPKKSYKNISLIIAISVAGVIWLASIMLLALYFTGHFSKQADTKQPDFDGNQIVSTAESNTAELAKKVSPSVVSIVTVQRQNSGFFQQDLEGAGTGIIISKNGYILTNKHVVKGARSAEIVTSDGQRYDKVELVGVDPLNDIAFLKIKDVDNLPAATLGDSGSVRVGQEVIAIGNSLGQYQNTVTRGIVSGLGRPVVAAADSYGTQVESLTDLIQTDAAINRGNSGGPLLNMAGQVIGINTAIVNNAQSMGFAIPINAAKGMARGVLKNGKVEKAFIGVQYVPITPDVRVEYDLSVRQGALVRASQSGSAVSKGGPADKAGLKDGDIITKVNQKIVGEQGGLGSLLAEFLPGEKVKLTVLRGDKTKELTVSLSAYQSQN